MGILNAAARHFFAGMAVLAIFASFIPEAAAYVEPRLKPPAPGPSYGTPADHARLEVIINAMKRKNFGVARATAETLDDPIAKSLGQWLYFYGEDPNVSIRDADRFLDLHQDWPAASRIQTHVEKKMTNTTSTDVILDFYDTRDPIGGHGKLQLARALFASGDQAAGEIHLRDAWVNHTFPIKDERIILNNYGGRLKPEDHIARVDHLLWKRQVTNARRIIPRLPASERRKAEARAALLMRDQNAVRLFNSLNDADRSDSGVLMAAVRYFRRGDEQPRAVSIARTAPTTPEALRNPSRWWLERKMLLRWAIEERRYDDAYAMAAGHGLEPGTEFSEAEFFAGWLALRYLGDPERAETHFKALTATVSAPISVARGNYWLGRTAEAMKNEALSRDYYQRAARHVYTFYGQLAAEKIGGAALSRQFDSIPRPNVEESTRFASRPTVAALRMLSDLDNDQAFLVFAYHIDDKLESPGEYLELAEITNGRGAPHITVRAGKVSVRKNAFAPEVSYPLVFVPDEAKRYAPAEVILGLSRQESEFNPRAYSRAGARGMMQLIPSTAKITARKEGLRYSRSALLDDPVYNMTIGSAHLSHLFQRYNGSYVMTFAAYNAGAHRVTQWVEKYGDPRSAAIDPIDWAESIPFSETRNYVQRVLENTQVYRGRFTGGPIPGNLSKDLERGGKRGRAGKLPGKKYAGNVPPVPARTLQFASAAPVEAPEVQLKPKPPAEGAEVAETGRPPQTAVDPATAPTAPLGQEATPTQTATVQPEAPAVSQEPSPAPSVATETMQPPRVETETTETSESAITSAESTEATPAPKQRGLTAEDLNRLQHEQTPETSEPTETVFEAPPQPSIAASPPPPTVSADELNSLQSGALTGGSTTTNNTYTLGSNEIAAQPVNPAATISEECETYRAYIARTEKEEAAASDLNAGMLAELQSGGPACE